MPTKNVDTPRVVEELIRLRSAERSTEEPLRDELRSTREFLEDLVGPTVSRAEAARLLGVSQTALDRWVGKDEIAAVLTPQGRREVPLAELLSLLEDVRQVGVRGSRRPLAAVIRERRREAEESVDLNRLLPSRRRRGHRVAELQSLAYHRLVAERLDEEVADRARRRLERWRDAGRIHPHWAQEWESILDLPLEKIGKAIAADTARARELRQSSPFVGVLTEQERRRLATAVEQRALA